MKSVFLKSASGLLEVGQNSPIRVNCNVGINSEAGRAYETERLEAIKNSDCQPDTFMDLSIGELNEPFYNEIQKRFDCPIGYVPSGGQGHTVKALESGSVILECKEGAYEPLGEEDILNL